MDRNHYPGLLRHGDVDQAGAVTASRKGKLAIDVRSQTAYEAGTVLNAIRVDDVRLVTQLKHVLNGPMSRW